MSTSPPRIVLVTGGAGFIGSHVCDALLEQSFAVRCMDNFATSRPANIEHLRDRAAFSFMEGDIRDPGDCTAAVADVSAVVHLAALGSVPRSIADPLASHATNLTGFLHMLDAARVAGVRRFVYASSSSVYGDSPVMPKQEAHVGNPLSPYAVTKAGNEAYAGLYARLHGMGTIGLRFFNVFGERQDPEGPYAAAIPRFIKAFLGLRSPEVHGDGLQSRDFTYVGNAVQAVMAALHAPEEGCAGEVFNVACGVRTTLLELVDALRDELVRMDPAVAAVQVTHVAPRQGDVRDSLADVGKARERLGYTPAYTLREGLRKAVPWYVEHWG